VVFGGEQFGGLQDDVGLVEAGGGAQRADDVGVETALADHGVGQVDDGVADGVEAGDGGAGGDGLAGADLAGDHPQARSPISQLMRATASAWVRWRCSMLGARSRPKGMRLKP
jgi:hypothetical protein